MNTFFKYFTIVLLLLSSCDKDEIVKTINSDILVSTKIENNDVYILAETVKDFQCMTYSITYSIQKNGNIINLEFLDVVKPDACYLAFGPAKAEINLGILEDDEYTIKFKLDGKLTEAKLYVTSTVYLEITKSGNVKLKQ